MTKNKNGNNQVNEARESTNNKVAKLKGLGNTFGAKIKRNRRNKAT